jgi:hypothetical protein
LPIAEWRGCGTLEAHRYLNMNDLREHNPTSAKPHKTSRSMTAFAEVDERNAFGELVDGP